MRLISMLIMLTLLPRSSFAEPDTISYGMAQGEALVVRLPSNLSTGFGWEIVRIPPFLEQLGELEFVPDAKKAGMVGVGEVAIWRFHIAGSGTGVLGFAYRRPWETAPPVDVVEYRLTAMP